MLLYLRPQKAWKNIKKLRKLYSTIKRNVFKQMLTKTTMQNITEKGAYSNEEKGRWKTRSSTKEASKRVIGYYKMTTKQTSEKKMFQKFSVKLLIVEVSGCNTQAYTERIRQRIKADTEIQAGTAERDSIPK